MEEVSEVYKVAMLVDQLKHEEEAQRVAASKCLVRIAKVLGPERTREELLPFLAESQGDEDAVLAVIAEKLGELVDCVGGGAYAHVLLVPLEPLVAIDDAGVRAAAIVSVEAVASAMSDAQIASELVPCVLKLASKDWFTSRISAALLVAVAHTRCVSGPAGSTAASSVGEAFLKLCADDTPMVRRVAAGQLFKLAESAVAQGGSFEDAGSMPSKLLDTAIQLAGTCTALPLPLPLRPPLLSLSSSSLSSSSLSLSLSSSSLSLSSSSLSLSSSSLSSSSSSLSSSPRLTPPLFRHSRRRAGQRSDPGYPEPPRRGCTRAHAGEI